MSYDPNKYWQQRGGAYTAEPTKVVEELNWLCKLLDYYRPAKLLDVGSGWGRVYNYAVKHSAWFASDSRRWTMVDFVEAMRQGCYEHTGVMPDHWDGHTLSYSNNRFDAVLAFDMLLHVEPALIDQVFSEIVRVCKGGGKIFIATHGVVRPPMADHCFWHDYLELAGRHKCELEDIANFKHGRLHYIFEVVK